MDNKNDNIVELAKMFKDRENPNLMGPQLGTVVKPPPNILITVMDKILLTNENTVFSAHVLNGYQRNITIPETTGEGSTSSVSIGDHGSHNHDVDQIGLNGSLVFNDTLKKGDQVIVIPSRDHQLYYVVDKAVTL